MTKEEKAEYSKRYREIHREELLLKKKMYRETHKEQIKEASIKYKNEVLIPKQKRRIVVFIGEEASKRKYVENNKNKVKESKKRWEEKNKEKVKKYRQEHKKERRIYLKEKYSKDLLYRLTTLLRTRLKEALNKNLKSKKTIELLGCSAEELKKYLESKFQEGMSWENYGLYGWHIDHIRPCASFNLINEEEQRQCFHYTNLQPLWAEDNLRKHAKY